MVDISINLIHEFTGLHNEGSSPLSEKNVKKLVEINIGSISNGRKMKVDKIKHVDVR